MRQPPPPEGAPTVTTIVEFSVLGSTTVTSGATELNIGGPKQRTVLAMLIAHVGRPVNADLIAQAVYGEDTPTRGRRRVQVYVSTLRSELGDTIRKTGNAWQLDVARTAIDTHRFEDLVDSARDLPPAGAAEVLREALALWRGHPYTDIEANGVLDAEIVRLEQLRIAALSARLDADLALGRDADLVGEIEGLIAEHPYTERFRAQHMLALYRSGRQREALRSYSDLRSLLVDEMGVEPTPELRELEQRILDQDDSLLLPPERSVVRRAVLVVDPGEPLELARLPSAHREELLRTSTIALGEVCGERSLHRAGWATYVVFESAADAAGATTELATRLDGTPVRLALDWGDIEVATESVTGPPVRRAAALVSLAHPGQIVLSAEAQTEIVADGGGLGLRFEALGGHELPGIEDRLTIYQLLVGDPPRVFPSLVTDRIPPPLPEGVHRSVAGFELRESIGEGSAGTLYRAYQPSVGREVIVEVIGRAVSSDADFIRRFETDAQRLALLDHPNINPLLDYWRDTDGAYLVYRHHRAGFLTAATRDAVVQIGAALSYAHSYGVVHGSVRPDRIMLDDADNALLMCFPVGGITPRMSAMYPAYIPPEVLDGARPTEATDVYALGLLAQEAECGSVAADAAVAPASPAIAQALTERPGERHGTVEEFLYAWAPPDAATVAARYTATRNPYKGLSAFHESDVDDFFGRSAVVDELVEHAGRSSFLAVVGPSGIGKSSVVRAGLLPRLRAGALQGSDRWVITDMLPGPRPFLELERAIERVAVDLPATVRERFAAHDPEALSGVKELLPDGAELVVVIDQFEELFTMADESVAHEFLGLLTNALTAGDTRILVTLRADFLDRPLLYSEFGELIGESMVTLPAPNTDELAELITLPAAGVGVRIDDALLERLTSDVHDRPGGLPLLQFALVELFESRTSDLITIDQYDDVGGVTGALASRAETVFGQLPPAERAAAQQAFLRMVAVVDDMAATRRRVRLAQLDELGATSAVEAFVRNRMLVSGADPETRAPTVEVAHEALLSHWPRLAGWIETARSDLVLARRLDEAISDWEANGRLDGYLLAGNQLAQHQAWSDVTSLALTPRETDFLERSIERDRRARVRRRRQRRVAVTTFAAAAVIATVFGMIAFREADRAERERELADARALVASGAAVVDDDPELAVMLAVNGAAQLGEDVLALAVLRESLAASQTVLYHGPGNGAEQAGRDFSGDISMDGTRVAIGGSDPDGGGTVTVRDVDTGQVLWTRTVESVTGSIRVISPRFVSGGAEIAVGVWYHQSPAEVELPDAGVHILDAETGDELRRHGGPRCGWRLDTKKLEVGTRLLAWANAPAWEQENGCAATDAVFTRMAQLYWLDLVTGGIEPIGPEFNDNSGFPVRVARAEDAGLQAVFAPLPEGEAVSVGGASAEGAVIQVEDLATGEVVMETTARESFELALSPDGTTAAIGGTQGPDNGSIVLMDATTGDELEVLDGHPGSAVVDMFFTHGGGRLLSVANNGTVKVWDVGSFELLRTIDTGDAGGVAASLTADGGRIGLFGASHARVLALDPAELSGAGSFHACGGGAGFYINAGLVVRDDRALTRTVCEDDTAPQWASVRNEVFDTATGDRVAVVGRGTSQGGDLSPDVRLVADQIAVDPTETSPGLAGTVVLRDAETGEVMVTMDGICDSYVERGIFADDCQEPPAEPYGVFGAEVKFSPDGSLVALGSGMGGPGRVWDTTTGETVATWPFFRLAWSPDGDMIATWSIRNEVLEIRDTERFEVLASRPLDAQEQPDEMAFADDALISVTWKEIHMYDTETLDRLDHRSVLDPHEAPIQSIGLSDDRTMLATGSQDGFVRVWSTTTSELLLEIPVDENNRIQGIAFANDDTRLLATTADGPVRGFLLDPDDLIDFARSRVVREFTPNECERYFRESACPTLAEMREA
jgi:DNA-binding SARP family transcriptional activator/WD40 repeat protein